MVRGHDRAGAASTEGTPVNLDVSKPNQPLGGGASAEDGGLGIAYRFQQLLPHLAHLEPEEMAGVVKKSEDGGELYPPCGLFRNGVLRLCET